MAKDDYQVLVTYILAYLYKCLKNGEAPQEGELSDKFFQISRIATLFKSKTDNVSGYQYYLRMKKMEGITND